jgi:ABC-2 type transport system permease protein
MEDCKVNNLSGMIWIEMRKAIRSRVPLWTAVGSLFMPLGIAFLIFVARNPDIAKNLGLVGAKANLVSYSGTDWPAYMGFFAQIVAIGGFFLFVLIISWVFGREFIDGTLKDMLAVPVQRSSIILAKFIVVAIWSAALTLIIFIAGLVMGAVIQLPGGSTSVILQYGGLVLITAFMAIGVVTPYALFASVGRGYLLPMGLAILTLMMTNLLTIIGWGEYIPWSVPGLYAVGKTPLTAVSYWIVLLTGLAGIIATYLWWKYADQNR